MVSGVPVGPALFGEEMRSGTDLQVQQQGGETGGEVHGRPRPCVIAPPREFHFPPPKQPPPCLLYPSPPPPIPREVTNVLQLLRLLRLLRLLKLGRHRTTRAVLC